MVIIASTRTQNRFARIQQAARVMTGSPTKAGEQPASLNVHQKVQAALCTNQKVRIASGCGARGACGTWDSSTSKFQRRLGNRSWWRGIPEAQRGQRVDCGVKSVYGTSFEGGKRRARHLRLAAADCRRRAAEERGPTSPTPTTAPVPPPSCRATAPATCSRQSLPVAHASGRL